LFVPFSTVQVSLAKISQFPGETLYLVPEPEDPFRELTLGIWRCCPETPPYRGRYSTVVPHLTVADGMGEPRLAEVAREFEEASQGRLPIHGRAVDVTLMDSRSNRWEINTTFRLGQER
jgi:hypothetical protein